MDLRDLLIKPSTRKFIREARQARDYSLFDFIHGYIYARWTYFYIAVGTGRHPWSKKLAPLAAWLESKAAPSPSNSNKTSGMTFADTYHGKAVPLEAVKQLVNIREDIALPDLEQVIPYKRARDIVLKNPDHLVVIECPCRSAKPNPCLPLDVCIIVGEPFTGFVMEHNPGKSRWITSQEAAAIIDAEDARGHVHHAFFKDAMFGRFYAICNCCACCCGAIQAHQHGTPMLASSGYLAQIDEDSCTACSTCTSFCQFGALNLASFQMSVDAALCMGCGVCVDKCPQEAISLRRDESKSAPLEILSLMQQASSQV